MKKMVRPHNRTVFSLKKEGGSDTSYLVTSPEDTGVSETAMIPRV